MHTREKYLVLLKNSITIDYSGSIISIFWEGSIKYAAIFHYLKSLHLENLGEGGRVKKFSGKRVRKKSPDHYPIFSFNVYPYMYDQFIVSLILPTAVAYTQS